MTKRLVGGQRPRGGSIGLELQPRHFGPSLKRSACGDPIDYSSMQWRPCSRRQRRALAKRSRLQPLQPRPQAIRRRTCR